MLRIVVHDDRGDVIVVVKSLETWILIDAEDIPLVVDHVVVVVILGDMVDAAGITLPRG